MAVRQSLGPLQYIRVWHDNSGIGESASWFLNYVTVRDLQNSEKWHFIVDKWLGIAEDDGQVRNFDKSKHCILFHYLSPLDYLSPFPSLPKTRIEKV